ncbi:MAG: aromatic ring-hydroxylating dioxygenase subunit alpha [Alicyclobacillus sp.]|nr:aromatic ring-hydroxylating dioxygenase subunit alpha [Alicyclobacillus sp.]
MIRRAWYAVRSSDNLRDRPEKVEVAGVELVLWRGRDGVAHAAGAYCPHRGCDLSHGTLTGDALVCPFHGWQFDRDGRCTHIPSLRDDRRIPPTARLDVYPVQEQAGLIWVYPVASTARRHRGAAHVMDVPPLRLFPELSDECWRKVPFSTEWHAHFGRVVESVLDVSHLPFVHPETTGWDVDPAVDGPEYTSTPGGLRIHPTPFAPSHPMEPIPAAASAEARTEIELRFPNCWIIRTPMGEGQWMCTFLTFTPAALDRTQIFGVAMRNFEPDFAALDAFHLEHTHFVMEQDRAIVECLRPTVPPPLREEAHVPSDGPTIRFRRMLFDALAEEQQDVCGISSPVAGPAEDGHPDAAACRWHA